MVGPILLLSIAPSLDIGTRLAGAWPGGEASSGQPITNQVASAVSIGVDVGYRFHPQLSIGIYALPVIGLASPSGCPSNASCSGAGGQAGFEARYRLLEEPAVPRAIEPWVALGLGIDVLQRKETVTKTTSGILFNGTSREEKETFAYGPALLLQVGAEARMTKVFSLGAWLGLGLSQYWGTKYRMRVNGDERDASSGGVDDRTLHRWFFAGLRGTFEIQLRR